MHEPLGANGRKMLEARREAAASCRSWRPARCRRPTASTRPAPPSGSRPSRGPRGAVADREVDGAAAAPQGGRALVSEPSKATEQPGAGVPVAAPPVGASTSGARRVPAGQPGRARHVRRRTAPATRPASVAWSAPQAAPSAGPAARPYGGYFDEVFDALAGGVPGAGRRDRAGRGRPGRADPAHRAGADRRGLPGDARRRVAALRAVLLRLRCGLSRRRRAPAARRLPPHLDDLPAPGPAGGRGDGRATRTCRASPRSTRPPTGRSGRPTTCSASSSTVTRT